MLTLEELREASPIHIRKMITQNTVDTLNSMNDEDEAIFEIVKENMVSFSSILKTGKYKFSDYLNAVKFVSYCLMEFPDIDAYMLTFPERYQKLLQSGEDKGLVGEIEIRAKLISSYVSGYKKTKMVSKISENALIPSHVLNAPLFQEALNIQMLLARDAESEMVRTTAANSVLNILKAPEKTQIEIDIGIKPSAELDEIKRTIRDLSNLQLAQIESGGSSTKQVAESIIINAVVVDDD